MANDDLSAVPMPMGLLAPPALRQPGPASMPMPEAADVEINAEGPIDGVTIDPDTGAMTIEQDDGSVVIDFEPPAAREPGGSAKHDANLAECISSTTLAAISEDLLRGIQFDEQSRSEWLETRALGIRLLGLKIEQPRGDASGSSVALEGMSTVRHPLLLEATLRFQANARGELLPAAGPIKVTDKITETGEADDLAEALESGLNYYLTTTASEYYPDTDRLLFYTGFGGCGFKKVYNCPIRQRPVSESVDAKDLIVSDASTDLRNSARVTHQIKMRPSVLKRMQLAGAYRDVPLGTPNPSMVNPVDQQIADTQGIDPVQQQTEDRDHTVYEVYCELDIAGFEHKDGAGKTTGLQLPYRVVIERDSRQVLEVRRNWQEDDENRLAKICFVKYSFVPGLGFYDIGLVHILGNTTNALTAAWRELLDAGMFANFPGFLYSKMAGRQNTNEFRVPPGGGAPVETNGKPIGEAIMALPYKDISTAFAGFIDNIAETGQRIGGTAEVQIAEGRADAPVGTTLALIEQATKIMDAVHKRLHAAQAEEFQLLKECFRENPEAFVKSVKGNVTWDTDKFMTALNDASIVPMADPNTPSHMHRLMKAMALKQLQGASPQLYNAKAIDERVLHMIGIEDAETLFAAPSPAAPNPEAMKTMAELALKKQGLDQKAANDQQKLQLDKAVEQSKAEDRRIELHAKLVMQDRESQDQAADRQERAHVAALGVVSDLINHPESLGVAHDAARQFGAA